MEYHIHSIEELQTFANTWGATLIGGDVVALSGELGAGKTTLVSFVAQMLGITKPITSPTFVVCNIYSLPVETRGIYELCHIDLYRVQEQHTDIGLEEYIGNARTLSFVEWPEYGADIMPVQTKKLHIAVLENNNRVITKLE